MNESVQGAQTVKSDAAVRAATGRGWDDWFARLDQRDWQAPSHREITAAIVEDGVGWWWAHGIAIGYEQARGLRAPGQRRSGSFEVTSSRTIARPQSEAFELVAAVVAAWLGTEPIRVNAAAKYPNARFAVPDDELLLVMASPSTGPKTSVSLTWSKLADAAAVEDRRAQIKALLATL